MSEQMCCAERGVNIEDTAFTLGVVPAWATDDLRMLCYHNRKLGNPKACTMKPRAARMTALFGLNRSKDKGVSFARGKPYDQSLKAVEDRLEPLCATCYKAVIPPVAVEICNDTVERERRVRILRTGERWDIRTLYTQVMRIPLYRHLHCISTREAHVLRHVREARRALDKGMVRRGGQLLCEMETMLTDKR